MKLKLVAAALAATCLTSISAQAATITPIFADCDPNFPVWSGSGVACGVTADRRDATKVNLGDGDGEFYSLGLETNGTTGAAVFQIDPAFTGPGMVVEVTNSGSNHWEAADVFVANADASGAFDGSTAVYAGTVNNGKGGTEAAVTTLNITGIWKFIYIQDASHFTYGTVGNGTTDGFDLDSIKVSVVPLPAGALLLGSALVGLGIARRKS